MKKELILAVGLIAVFTTSASAGVINLQYKGKGDYGRNLNGVTAHFSNSGGTKTYSGYAGLLKIQVSGDQAFNYDGMHQVFCTELNEYAGANRVYELDYLDNLDIPYSDPAKAAPMSVAQKDALKSLFSLVPDFNAPENDATKDFLAAGFQVAVWEVSQDTAFGDLSSGGGNFFLTGSNSNYAGIKSAAEGFLAGIGSASAGGGSYLGMRSNGAQDFVDFIPVPAPPPNPVPEPASFALWSLGLIGVSLRRRRA